MRPTPPSRVTIQMPWHSRRQARQRRPVPLRRYIPGLVLTAILAALGAMVGFVG